MVSAIVLAFTSCTDSTEVDIKYQVSVTVDPSSIQSSFHGYLVGNETYGLDLDSDSQLLITSLIYDRSGSLVAKNEALVNDYSSSYNYTINMPEGEEYTVVAITFAVDKKNDVDSYVIEHESRLDKLTVTTNYRNGNSFYSSWTMLGIASKVIGYDDREYQIHVKPASAFVVLRYLNIHQWDDLGIDKHWIAYTNNEQAKFNNTGVEFVSTTAVNSGNVTDLDVTENPNSNNIFEIFNLLPTSKMTVWAGFNVGEDEATYSEFLDFSELDPNLGRAVVDIEAGKEYMFVVDCAEFTISVGAMTKSNMDSCSSLSYGSDKNNHNNKEFIPNIITPEQSLNVMQLVKSLK